MRDEADFTVELRVSADRDRARELYEPWECSVGVLGITGIVLGMTGLVGLLVTGVVFGITEIILGVWGRDCGVCGGTATMCVVCTCGWSVLEVVSTRSSQAGRYDRSTILRATYRRYSSHDVR